jgi:hypothetical protein
MEPLNYCRQLEIQLQESTKLYEAWDKLWLQNYSSKYDETPVPSEAAKSFLAESKQATKFIFPKGGVIIDDPEFRGIDGLEKISLPFEKIIIEMETGIESTPKVIILAEQNEEQIICKDAWFYTKSKKWVVHGGDGISIDRADPFLVNGENMSGERAREQLRKFKMYMGGHTMSTGPVLCLINALACSNVSTEKIETRPTRKKAKQHAIGFDIYHHLTITPAHVGKVGGGQSSRDSRLVREHLRRGHIRRLNDGRRIWVNAAVVNAGIGAKVSKDYVIRPKEKALGAIARSFHAHE